MGAKAGQRAAGIKRGAVEACARQPVQDKCEREISVCKVKEEGALTNSRRSNAVPGGQMRSAVKLHLTQQCTECDESCRCWLAPSIDPADPREPRPAGVYVRCGQNKSDKVRPDQIR